jgi:nifR3 family TIM-barrel protein
MVNAVTNVVEKPVTVKMRLGWDDDHIFILDNVKAAQTGGAAAIAIHGRTRAQQYEGTANWDWIGEAKKVATVPIIGNGDIATPQDAKRVIDQYGVDAVMIGRAALGNPWMLYQTVQYLETGELPPEPAAREKIDICMLHLDRLSAIKGELTAVREMRQHAAWYLKGLKGSGPIRKQINETESREAFAAVLYGFVDQLERQLSEV